MKKIKRFKSRKQKEDVLLSILNSTPTRSSVLLGRLHKKGFEWRGTAINKRGRGNLIKTDSGRVASLGYFLSRMKNVNFITGNGGVKEFYI